MTVVLLGPQRFDPSLADAAQAIGVRGQVALVTAGWQEREREDDELREHLGGRTVNLTLHRRADDVFKRDPELRAAYRERQVHFRRIQDFYRIRLEHLIAAARVVGARSGPADLLEAEQADSVAAIRVLDRHHQRRCAKVRSDFKSAWTPHQREVVAEHRAELRELLEPCEAIAIAGGHVASLVNRLALFGIASLRGERPVLAWSAGAMAVTERVVVFHDDPPYGLDAPQILDSGLGFCRGVVAMPNPEARLRTHEPDRMRMYAQRFAPARCLLLPRRSWVHLEGGAPRAAVGVLELKGGAASALEVAA